MARVRVRAAVVVVESNRIVNEKPTLGLLSAMTLVAASMIGVGVYTTSGFTLAALGSPAAVIAAWTVGGVIAICGAIGYASLAAKFAQSGGEYLFLSRVLHPAAGVMAGLVSMLNGFTGAIALAALGLEQYARPLIGDAADILPEGAIAIGVVVLAAVMHTVGVRGASKVQDAIVVAKLLMIAGFILLAFFRMLPVIAPEPAPAIAPEAMPVQQAGLLDFIGQLVWISFSYAGFNAAIYIAGEIRDAKTNVPRAMIGGTILVTVLYVALNAIFVTSAPISVITADDNISQVAATSAAAIGGDGFAALVSIVIVVSLWTSVSAMVMTGPRVYATMADDGVLPSWFRFGDGHVPAAAIWFQSALAIAAISVSSLAELLGYLGLTLSLCSALTVAMVFVLRRRGEIKALPWFGIPPAIYVVATLVIAAVYASQNVNQVWFAGGTLAIGVALIGWSNRKRQP